jgi:hypothetical protein
MSMQPDSVVFVVDDAAVREAIQSLSRSVGLHVKTFASAQEFLRGKRPDVLTALSWTSACPASSASNCSAGWPMLPSTFRLCP